MAEQQREPRGIWNHRVVRTISGGEYAWQLAEVYYDDDGRPEGWCDADVLHSAVDGETDAEVRAGLLRQVEWLREAVGKPWLRDIVDFTGKDLST